VKRTVITIGLQKTGKTTYLAAFWDVVESGEVVGSLQLVGTSGDMQYLNEIRNLWANCQTITRTGPASDKPVVMQLKEDGSNAITELAWTDMLGESFELQWTERAWTSSYQQLVDDAVGLLLFIHPRQVKDPPLIVDAKRALGGISPSGNAPKGVASKGEASNTDASAPISDAAEADASNTDAQEGPTPPPDTPASTAESKASPFDARKVATQVQLVELLQFLDARRTEGKPLRVSLIVSAWDLIEKTIKTEPLTWVKKVLPMLYQFLYMNDDRFEVRIFGVSAQGGDYVDAVKLRKTYHQASERIKVVSEAGIHKDITAPVRWSMGSPVD